MAVTTSQIENFPFSDLPQLSAGTVELHRKLQKVYDVVVENPDLLTVLTQSLEDILHIGVSAKPLGLESKDITEILNQLPDRALIGVLRLEPQSKRSFLMFDTALAQILVNSVLSGGREAVGVSVLDEVLPLTPLSEAVVQYVMVLALEKISKFYKGSLVFENVLRDTRKLPSLCSHHERFAVFPVVVTVAGRDFFLKLALPFMLVEGIQVQTEKNLLSPEQKQRFDFFAMDFQLEVGSVTLSPEDLEGLSVGDVIFFDECLLARDASQLWSGPARLKPVGVENEGGYILDVKNESGILRAELLNVL